MRYTSYIHLLLQCVFKNRIWGNCVCIYIYTGGYPKRIIITAKSQVTWAITKSPLWNCSTGWVIKATPRRLWGKTSTLISSHPVLVSICLASFLGVATTHQPPETQCLDRFAAAAQHSRRRYRFGPRQAGLPQHKLHIGIYPSKSE